MLSKFSNCHHFLDGLHAFVGLCSMKNTVSKEVGLFIGVSYNVYHCQCVARHGAVFTREGSVRQANKVDTSAGRCKEVTSCNSIWGHGVGAERSHPYQQNAITRDRCRCTRVGGTGGGCGAEHGRAARGEQFWAWGRRAGHCAACSVLHTLNCTCRVHLAGAHISYTSPVYLTYCCGRCYEMW